MLYKVQFEVAMKYIVSFYVVLLTTWKCIIITASETGETASGVDFMLYFSYKRFTWNQVVGSMN